jgi:serine/threonine protein kinase
VLSGTNFGILSSDITIRLSGPASSCDPVSITVSDNLITCVARLVDTPEVASGSIAAVVVRAGGSSDSGRGSVVGTVIPQHSVTASNRGFPANGRNLIISGQRFPASVATLIPVNVTLSAGSQQGIRCIFSGEMTATSLQCSLDAATPIPASYRGALTASVEFAGYTTVAQVALIVDPPIPDNTTSRRIPSNLASIRIGGSGFGNDTAALAIFLELTQIGQKRATSVSIKCEPTLANNTFIFCTPLSQLIENTYVDAIVSVSGGSSAPARLGYIGASVSVNNSIDIQKVAQNADTVFIYGDGFASGADAQQNTVVLSPGGQCIVRSATFSKIECGVVQPFGSVSNVKATVSAYGAQATGTQPVIAQVVPTATITGDLSSITLGSPTVTINGQHFDATSTLSTRVWLSLNNEPEFGCTVQSITETSISCQVDVPLNTSGTLTARVRAYFGNSTVANVGRIVDTSGNSGVGVGAGANPGLTIGVSVAVVAFVLIVAAVVIIIVRRRLQALKNIEGDKVDIPTEMAHLFSIVSSDLQIISKLGEGAYGAVYLGKYARLRSHVAIKKLTGGGVHAAEFFREAALMMSISPHPNVVRIRTLKLVSIHGALEVKILFLDGMCQEQTNFSLVMEFLPNGALDSWAAGQAESGSNEVEASMLYRFSHGIAKGMAHLAASRIVHRDLAARNILLGSDYTPKVSDFGMSRVVSDESREGQTNSTVGPIKWMPQESLRDRQYSEKSDVWSYGVTLFELLTGHAPYQGIDLLSVAVGVRDHGLTPLKELEDEEKLRNLQIPSYIKQLMVMCFKFAPEDRPSFEQIAVFLEGHRPSAYADTSLLEDDEHAKSKQKSNKKGKGKEKPSIEPLQLDNPKSRYQDTTLDDDPHSGRDSKESL